VQTARAAIGVHLKVILISPRFLSFSEALWPPVEQGRGADQIRTGLQRHTAGGLGVFEGVDRGKMAVHEDGVGERPQMLGGLQFGGIRRQEEQMHVVGDLQALGLVPACAVQDQHDLLGGAGSHRGGKGSELGFEKRDVHARRQMKDGPPRGRVHEPDEVAPFVAVLDGRHGALAVKPPHFVQYRFQADAVLVNGPEFDTGAGEGGRDLPEEWTDLFLKVACSAASACTWRGRGVRRLPSRRTRYAQPRYTLIGRPNF
jgi:hypothetical protein